MARLTVEERVVRLAIDDNGRGFRPEAVLNNGSGLNNMQVRLAEYGGRAEILSAPLQGTKIRFTFPLSASPRTSCSIPLRPPTINVV